MSNGVKQSLQASRLLLSALQAPDALAGFSEGDWDLLLRVARRTRLLGRLDAEITRCGLSDAVVPARAGNHLRSARNLARHRQTQILWEVDRILWALEGVDIPVIALKGAAYLLAHLPNAPGRFSVDVDLLVSHRDLEAVESRLCQRGWLRMQIDPYDEHYYRFWMHEIPPLRHREREIEIDIHHRILPQTSRFCSDPSRLFDQIQHIPSSRIHVLGPHDMVLHAIVHLFLEGDPQEGLRLRDLVDVVDLLRHYGAEIGFWDGLVPRSEQLGLQRPLYYGLRFASQLLRVEVPGSVTRQVSRWAPIWPIRRLMDWLVPLAILPEHPDYPRRSAAFARWLLYMRAHWLRMPPLLLVRHLGYKAWLRVRGVRKIREIAPQDLKRM